MAFFPIKNIDPSCYEDDRPIDAPYKCIIKPSVCFLVLDAESKEPMINSEVAVIIGKKESSMFTDGDGYLVIEDLKKGEKISIHVLHKAPKRFLSKKGK